MKGKAIVLILGISIIEILATSEIIERSHSDDFDITLIFNIHTENNKSGRQRNIFDSVKYFPYYDAEFHLRTNAIGIPLQFNGNILSSDKKSLEFIADINYPNNISTNNIVEYDLNEWMMSTLSMQYSYEDYNLYYYDLLLWKANNNKESFTISWTQKNTIQTCISISYILKDSSECTLSMEIINQNKSNLDVLHSYTFEQTKNLKTVLFKSSELLFENITYSLKLNLKKFEKNQERTKFYYHDYNYHYYYTTPIPVKTNCGIGIKRIAECTDKYEIEELYTTTAEDNRLLKNISQFNIYPFGNAKLLSKQFLNLSICLNGGYLYKNECVCPPGFKGNACEYACGPNTFGVDCSGMCSMHRTGCQEMMFCTTHFGCKCPSGFRGDNCEKECSEGTYGVDCEQLCSEGCYLDICDIYTGSCTKGCKQNYISPNCSEKYPWLNEPPQLETSDFHSLKLRLNFHSTNIRGSKTITPIYYQIIFKPSKETEYQYTELKEIEEQKSVIEIIDNLKPETLYSFGVILVSEDGNQNFDDIVTANYSTLCQLATYIDYGVKLVSDIDQIHVTWNKQNIQNETECKINYYALKLMINGTDMLQESNSEEVMSNNYNYTFKNLLSNQQYAIEIIAISSRGPAVASKISYISTKPYGFVKIQNVKAQFLNNQNAMVITWDTNDKYEIQMTFIVKYKINKYFSCSHEIVKNNWTSLMVFNEKKCEIWDTIPNSQYIIQILPAIEGYDYKHNENIVFLKTPISTPKLTAVYVENSTYITNETAYFNWTINKNECSKLNGFFLNYHVVLKNILKGTQIINSTKQGTINYNAILDPNTKYELQVYVRTNYGINTEQVLSIPFQTKPKFLVPVDNLTVYKKNLKHKSIGIRWSYPDEYVIDGFIILVINDEIDFTKEIIVSTEKCVAWPMFYCATFEGLIPNKQYTIKIKAKSIDYPIGGNTASIVSNFNDGFSDKPENLEATNVSSNHISLKWDIPWIINGVLKSFIINVEEISFENNDQCCDSRPDVEIQVIKEMPTYNYTIYNLKPGSTYLIGVLSKTSLYGQTNRIRVTTKSMPDIDT